MRQKKGAELKRTVQLYELKDAELEITARMPNTHAILQARIDLNCVNYFFVSFIYQRA